MIDGIKSGMAIVGADGVTVGTVDSVGHHSITLMPATAGAHAGHHHQISAGLVAAVEGNVVRLSANADVAITFEEEG